MLAYTLAGADCVDVAADPAVIRAARDALSVATHWKDAAQQRGFSTHAAPWLMISLNDGEDPHFRKAFFDPFRCPPDCSRPCEVICPAQAIAFTPSFAGVSDDQCYGCGRCVPVCPFEQISTRSYVSTPAAIVPLLSSGGVDALEIHTQVGRLADFKRLWATLAPFASHLKLVAISCPDGEDLLDYLWALYDVLNPLPCPLVWQTDGRPMSGDIGIGTTRAALKLGQKVLMAGLPGYVQLAGGTNHHTVTKLKALGLHSDSSSTPAIAGVAYGSYARTLLAPVLEQLETCSNNLPLEAVPDLLWESVHLAHSLVSQLKPSMRLKQTIPKRFDPVG